MIKPILSFKPVPSIKCFPIMRAEVILIKGRKRQQDRFVVLLDTNYQCWAEPSWTMNSADGDTHNFPHLVHHIL